MVKRKIKKSKKVLKVKKIKSKEISPAKVKVVGVGGAGGNAVSRMAKTFPKSISFLSINTDIQDLNHIKTGKKICIGRDLTRGLGTGMKPELGRKAAEEARQEISQALKETDMVFITCGLGGGTGTGAGPVVADIARELGILTVAVVTRPFSFEGMERNHIADEGFVRLKEKVDAIIAIPNDRIFSLIDKETSLAKAFEKIDEVLKNAIEGVSEIIMTPGIVNVDFADIRAIIENTGLAVIGVGKASGKDRAINSANLAANSPLLEVPIDGARGLLFSISSNRDLKMEEVNEIAKLISSAVDSNAKIIFGTYHNRDLRKGEIKTILVATGFMDHLAKPVMPQTDLFIQSKEASKEFVEEEKTLSLKLPKTKHLSTDKQTKKKMDDIQNNEDVWDVPAFLRKKKRH
ncbi:MAG: cell division protein FtsZ [Candidatus Paceibacterota bacterium]|jgi:cell division protein FtsZ